MRNHKWTGDRRKEMLLWVETCQGCGLLRYGWRFGKNIEYTYAEQNVRLTAFGVRPSKSIPLQLSLFADDLFAAIGGR